MKRADGGRVREQAQGPGEEQGEQRDCGPLQAIGAKTGPW